MKPFNSKNEKKADFRNNGDFALHGDVVVIKDNEPIDFKSMKIVNDHCLAYGEATGHAHKIFGEQDAFEVRECAKTKIRHLKVVRDVALRHQEHSPIVIPPGFYKIGIQQEYDPFEKMKRAVID